MSCRWQTAYFFTGIGFLITGLMALLPGCSHLSAKSERLVFGYGGRSNVQTGIDHKYESMSVWELSTRFAHPELYEGRDDFARQNALSEILERGIVKRGMTAREIQSILGRPHHTTSQKKGQSYQWSYSQLGPSGLVVDFDEDGVATKILWHFDRPDPHWPDYSREY